MAIMQTQFATSSRKCIVDRTKLEDLQRLIGEEKCKTAILNFRRELLACLEAVAGKTPDSAGYAHNLAGVAGLLGFDDLEEKGRLFMAAVCRNSDDLPQCTRSLIQAAERVKAVLEDELIPDRN